MSTPASSETSEPSAPVPVSGYAWYVLAALFLVTTFNVADRNILNVLLEPIKNEFDASDTAMGALAGPVFAGIHIFASLAIAALADRGVRRTIVAVGLFVWSGLTALSGLAQSLGQLVVVRLGVGAAEGAGSAPAHSLLCDYFPLDLRARVMTIFGVGGMVGIMAGYVVGGLVAEHYGWRSAFFVLGLPGIFLGVLILLSVREPERGRLDGVISAENISTRQVIRQLLGTRSYVHMVLGASYHAFAGMGWGPFLISYLIRSHDLSLGRASISLVFLNQGVAMLAALLAAWMCDRLGRSDIRWYMWIPTWGALLALPFSLAFVLWPAGGTFPLGPWILPMAFLPLAASSFFGASWNGPTLAMTQSVTPASMRSRASALTTGTYNLIGMGLGPLLVGFISDLLAPRYGVESLRYGLLVVGLAHVLGAVHHWRAARYLRADLDAVSRAA